MQLNIGDIADEAVCVTPSTKCEEVYSLFNKRSSLEGIIVCSNEQPVGIVMKTLFYQKLSTKYGFDLFMKRTIDLVMNKEPLIVDYSLPLAEVSSLAMNRNQDNLYDYVIVTKNDVIYGIVSIRDLLIKLSEVQILIARYSNPLTGLPGNYEIDQKLQGIIKSKEFSVLYIDIDSFKVFNDTYGFSEGDMLIRETANIVKQTISNEISEHSFVGHIGGDDFIAVLHHFNFEEVCKTIINRFDTFILQFYTEEEIEKGYIQAYTRQGTLENVPLVSISIAVIQNKHCKFPSVEQLSKEAAKIKKECKRINKSVFLSIELAKL